MSDIRQEVFKKKCCKCEEEKPLDLFYRKKRAKDGYSYSCKNCDKEYYKIKHNEQEYIDNRRKYAREHKDKLNENKRKYNKTQKKKDCDRRYIEKYPDRLKESQDKFRNSARFKEYHELYKPRRNKLSKERRLIDINYKIKFNLRVRVNKAVQAQGCPRFYRYDEYIGCTPEFLKLYLESKFSEGMCWDNYDIKGWHIDHIIPCDYFNLTEPEEQKKCFHYTNLQPLWWIDNVIKSNKIVA